MADVLRQNQLCHSLAREYPEWCVLNGAVFIYLFILPRAAELLSSSLNLSLTDEKSGSGMFLRSLQLQSSPSPVSSPDGCCRISEAFAGLWPLRPSHLDGQLCFRRQVEVIPITFQEVDDSIELLLTVAKQSFISRQRIPTLAVRA